MYNGLKEQQQEVLWRKLWYDNATRPKPLFILWMTCHEILATKNKLYRFGMLDNDECCFCRNKKTLEHLMFSCPILRNIWEYVWLQSSHKLGGWIEELRWRVDNCKRNGWRANILKCAIVETVYEV